MTLPPVQLGPVWATEVSAEAVRLHGQLNPTGIPASAHFEYVEEAAYEKDKGEGGDGFAAAAQTPEIDYGAGSEALAHSTLIGSLKPDTTYRYRYLAHDLFGDFPSAVRSFSTTPEALSPHLCPNEALRSGPAAHLPDCRAYELVSPVDKDGGDIISPRENTETALENAFARVDQATPAGDGLSYATLHAFGNPASSPYSSQYVARRDPFEGWSSASVNAPREGFSLFPGPGAAFVESQVSAFSEDLCSDWLIQDTDLALVPGAPKGVPNLYRRQDCEPGEGNFELLTTVSPPGFGKEIEEASSYHATLGGFSADGKAAAFKVPAALTPEARTVGVGVKLKCEVSLSGAKPSFKWLSDGALATGTGAESAEYTTAVADSGKAVQCQVIAENETADVHSGGKAGAIQLSNPANVVAPPPASEAPIAPPSISAPTASAPLVVGGPAGQVLSCDPRTTDWVGATSFEYQWYRNGVVLSGTSSTYTTTGADLSTAAAFQCVVSGKNAEGAKVGEASEALLTSPVPEPAAPDFKPRVLDLYRVYLHDASGLHLVSVLPSGEAARTHSSVGTALGNAGKRVFDSVQNAVSADGSRVFWSAQTKEPSPRRIHRWVHSPPPASSTSA